METIHGPPTRRPTLASSWDAAFGALAQSLRLTPDGLGDRDADWEELLAPPASGCAGPAKTGLCSGTHPRSRGSREGRHPPSPAFLTPSS